MHASEVTGDCGPLMSGEGVGRWSQPQVELVLGSSLPATSPRSRSAELRCSAGRHAANIRIIE